jgi:hypothetical protein
MSVLNIRSIWEKQLIHHGAVNGAVYGLTGAINDI